VRPVFDEKGLAGVHVQLVFDEMYSSTVILDFDRNGNGRFDPAEVAALQKDIFIPLREFDFFTHIKIDGKVFKVAYVTGFVPEIRDSTVTCRFFVPCHVPAGGSFREVKLSLYDQSYYHSVSLERNPVTYENQRSYEVSHRIGKNKNEAYYYGQVYPEEITLRFRKRHE
jgi:ABC-type uncharacterized transport system substrate-binding protein